MGGYALVAKHGSAAPAARAASYDGGGGSSAMAIYLAGFEWKMARGQTYTGAGRIRRYWQEEGGGRRSDECVEYKYT